MSRILIYSHDTFGLGNIRRMVRIAEALAAHDPRVSILIVTGSPMLHAFRLPPRIDYVKLPCLARDANGVYGVRHLDMAFDDAVRMRANLILGAAVGFSPDILLIDKKPLGVAGELAPALELLGRRTAPPVRHLLLRDILDTPEATKAVWNAHHYHGAIRRHYDSVLVVGDENVFDLADAYDFPAETRAKLSYCGYINRAADLPGDLATPKARKTVLVQAGGGEDGAQLIEAVVATLEVAGADRGFACRIVAGPELASDERVRLAAAAGRLADVDWIDFTEDMGREIAAADLVVSMGGYNSICEILSCRKRAIVVPRSTPVREQRIRAEAMSELGLLRMITPERLDHAGLLAAMREELDVSNVVQSRTARIRFNGLDQVCHRLLGPRVRAAESAALANPGASS